jgi:hypothetical protein
MAPTDSQRYSEYLGSYHFYPNSVEFRIVSSKALEKFKNVQSFQLNQLVNGNFFFDTDRREILLLKYDMWSRFLNEVENLFIQLHETNDNIRQKDLDIVIALAEKTAEKYEAIINEHKEGHFKSEFADIWMAVHQVSFDFLVEQMRKMHGSYEQIFVQLVDIFCEGLQYTLIEIHEINELFKHPDSEEAFLVISEFCNGYYREKGESLSAHRAKIYQQKFNIKKVWIKNYTDTGITFGIIQAIEDSGLEVDYKKSILN